jgi:hypothetical protein
MLAAKVVDNRHVQQFVADLACYSSLCHKIRIVHDSWEERCPGYRRPVSV